MRIDGQEPGYGPVRTVVSQESAGNRRSHADQRRFSDPQRPPFSQRVSVLWGYDAATRLVGRFISAMGCRLGS